MKNVLLFTLSLILCATLSAQTMEPTSENAEAIKALRMALDVFGHDMYQFGENIDKAYELDNDMFLALMFKGVGAGPEEGQALIKKAMSIETDLNAGEMVFKGMMANLGDTAYKAGDDASKLVELYPDDAALYAFVGYLYNSDGEPSKALELLKKAERTEPTPAIYNMMGYAYLQMQEMDEAKNAFAKYLELAPQSANPFDSMGDYFMAAEEYEAAAKSFEKAYEIDNRMTESKAKAQKARDLMD